MHDHGDRINLFELASRLRLEIGRAILAVKAAELLDLVDTPKQEVVLDRRRPRVRRRRRQRAQAHLPSPAAAPCPPSPMLVEQLRRAPERRLPAEVIEEELLAMHLPDEPYEALFETIVGWGRYGELLGYDPDDTGVYLDRGGCGAVAA